MYSPAAGKPFCFLANASYLFSKMYPSPGETEKKKQWTWCMRLASFSAEHFNTWEEGAREGFYTHLWVLEEQCIKSRTQSGGVAKKKKRQRKDEYELIFMQRANPCATEELWVSEC